MPRRTNSFQQLIAAVVRVLENGAVVTESVEFPDPVTGRPREVDIVVVRGQLQGSPVQIGIECVDHSSSRKNKKADVPWVEMQYGKHSRVKATDFVLLVSSTGFTATAKAVAESFGYAAITPNITDADLTSVIVGHHRCSVRASLLTFISASFNYSAPSDRFTPLTAGPDLWFVRADGSNLVHANEFEQKAATRLAATPQGAGMFVDDSAAEGAVTFEINDLTHDGEPLHVLTTDGTVYTVAPVTRLTVTARFSATNTAHLNLTQVGDFNGTPFWTGTAPIGDHEARYVVADIPGEGVRGTVEFPFDIP